MKIRLIATDLDGTLLRDDKTVSPKSIYILERMAKQGVHIVPVTGRSQAGIPEVVKTLPGVRYIITGNGACIVDMDKQKILREEMISLKNTIQLVELCEGLPVIYGCYIGNQGYISEKHYFKLEEYILDRYVLKDVLRLYKPVKDLKDCLKQKQEQVLKFQMFFSDSNIQKEVMYTLKESFPMLSVYYGTLCYNLEINASDAEKGNALCFLCDYLGIPMEDTIAFGDSTNDISLLCASGNGVAMKNAIPEVLKVANEITLSNNEDGVAKCLEKYL